MLEKITDENYCIQIEQSEKPVVLCFYATWCEQCQLILPELEKASAEKAEFYKFGIVNTDFEKQLSQEFKVENVPSIFLIIGKEKREASLEEIFE